MPRIRAWFVRPEKNPVNFCYLIISALIIDIVGESTNAAQAKLIERARAVLYRPARDQLTVSRLSRRRKEEIFGAFP